MLNDTCRIHREIRKDNLPSRKVASKCGFVQDPEQTRWQINYYGKPLDRFILARSER